MSERTKPRGQTRQDKVTLVTTEADERRLKTVLPIMEAQNLSTNKRREKKNTDLFLILKKRP